MELRVDSVFVSRLERAIGATAVAAARTRARQYPEAGARVLELAGAVAVDAGDGGGNNSSSAFGLGTQGPVSDEELERIEAFYAASLARRPARIFTSPHAHPSLFSALGRRGYAIDHFSSMLAAVPDVVAAPAKADIRRATGSAADVDALVAIERACFGEDSPVEHSQRRASPFFSAPSTMFLAYVDDAAVACGAVVVVDNVAVLIAGMCKPELRGRGLQSALIRARINHAQAADLVVALAEPGSTSERNLKRAGLELVTTTLTLDRAQPEAAAATAADATATRPLRPQPRRDESLG